MRRNLPVRCRFSVLPPFALATLVALLPARGFAVGGDVPIAGRVLTLSASATKPDRRMIAFRASDPAIVPPFDDPTSGASLFVFASNASGHCRAEIPLPASHWTPRGGTGAIKGWSYRDLSGSAQGIQRVFVRSGKIVVQGRGAALPCALEAVEQKVPVSVALRFGGTRYCAAFGGDVRVNKSGRFNARNAAAPAACPDTADFTIVSYNILHGLGCGSDFCRQTERVILAGQFIVDRGCPDVVALQEVINTTSGTFAGPSIVEAVQTHLLDICPFPYQVVYIPGNLLDDSLLLSRYPVIATELRRLKNNFRNVLFARIDHPIGPIDVFSTHLASDSDAGSLGCGDTGAACPPECVSAGAATLRDCQAVQAALVVEELHNVDAPAFVVGDFNQVPGSYVYNQYVDRGWTDAYLAAGNPECDPMTGIGCTSGRNNILVPEPGVNERIDFVFMVPPGPGSTCTAQFDSGADTDGDGTATRIFADVPNPFSPTCGGPAPDPLCWASDHNGVQVDVNCE